MRHPDLHQRNIYTRIHEACNVPLVTQPSDPRAFSWTAKLARGLFCPMICSGTIMPQLPDTLTHPPPPYHSNRGNRSHLPFLFYEQLATRRALQRPRRSFLPPRSKGIEHWPKFVNCCQSGWIISTNARDTIARFLSTERFRFTRTTWRRRRRLKIRANYVTCPLRHPQRGSALM